MQIRLAAKGGAAVASLHHSLAAANSLGMHRRNYGRLSGDYLPMAALFWFIGHQSRRTSQLSALKSCSPG